MRVLIAVEDNEYGQAIADFVSLHQWEPGTIFRILHSTRLDEAGMLWSDPCCCEIASSLAEERNRRAASLVKGVATAIQSKLGGVHIEQQIAVGAPKYAILDTAEEWQADMIIMGSHGRRGFSRFLLGSVSLSVLSQAQCSVMIVKLPPESEANMRLTQDTATTETKLVSAGDRKERPGREA